MERRSSRDDQHRVERQSNNPNVFDDEFAAHSSDEEDYAAVSDGFGFRPSPSHQGPSQPRHSLEASQARRSISAAKSPEVQQMPKRSSIAKPPLPGPSSFAMANDGSRDPFSDNSADASSAKQPNNAAQPLMHRASVASTSSFATMGARSQTPAGPSHPYGMYPQGTGPARSLSVTTSSTFRNPQGSVSEERPQHPYGMYTQNPVNEDEDEPVVPQQPIPVGFPGLNPGYHRQIGPDGEEQDIVGPDGHTEQLPPYSRYPEEGPTKASMAATSAVSSPVEAPRTANASQDTLIQPASPTASSITESSPVVAMHHLQQTPSLQESQQTEKTWREKNWTEKRRTRVLCGRVPIWLIILLVGLLVMFAIILGAAIGSMLSKAKDKDKNKSGHDNPQAQLSGLPSLFDASSAPAPTNAASIVVVGTYQMPLDQPEETQRNCINDSNQSNAWSCVVQGPPALIHVEQPNDGTYIGWLQNQDSSNNDNSLQYGLRPPTLSKQIMEWVTDWDETSRGAALHFQTLYDKVVVLPANFVSSTKLKRGHDKNNTNNMSGGRDSFKMPDDFKHRNQVQPGEFPWVCRWNDTFIEAFLFMGQNSTFAPTTTSFGQASSTPPPSASGSAPLSANPTTTPPASSIAIVNGVAQASPVLNFRRGPGGPSLYPRVVKVEERRTPNSNPAVCSQMEIRQDGTIAPRLDGNGKAIVEVLNEVDPSLNDFMKASSAPKDKSDKKDKKEKNKSKRDDPSNSCHCQWIVQ